MCLGFRWLLGKGLRAQVCAPGEAYFWRQSTPTLGASQGASRAPRGRTCPAEASPAEAGDQHTSCARFGFQLPAKIQGALLNLNISKTISTF